jgi:hypothetical protein
MRALLYQPGQLPKPVATDGLTLPSPEGYAQVSPQVAAFLGCSEGFVDILDCGPDYVAYSIFDYEGAPNQPAMDALSAISTHAYDAEDDDQVLQGPILLVTR